jgi:pimeloyl-ACP methyl ester carboxylesterase
MKRIIFILVLFFVASVPSAYAETHITDETSFDRGADWAAEGSPYVIDNDVYIPEGVALLIEPGVVVTTSSSSPGSLFVRGSLSVDGTAAQPVTINNLTGFWIANSTSTIAHAAIDVPTGLNVSKSSLVISSSSITDADEGIDAQGSSINILDSVISGNNYGIYSQPMPPPVFLSFVNFLGMQVAHAQTIASSSDKPGENHITVSGSSIISNHMYGIYNSVTNVVNADDNWWGSANGPGSTTPSEIFGNVDYAPWLTKDPATAASSAVCCSNVLFLPGIESSRLYVDQKSIVGHGTSTNELWEPNRNDDVRKLFMTASGLSVNSGIYTKDIIDSALGLFPIYKGFIAMMNGVVADKIINSWLPYPYDWRFDAQTAVSSKLMGAFLSLASTSKTGKVTIVAHSNGGLVAKLLAKALADKGESDLLDKVILVAVPQLGTPQAIAGLLHGDNESILGGFLLSQSVARQLAENMPGGYGLLPSRAYFSNVSAVPLVSFSSSTLADYKFAADGQTIAGYDALKNFMTGISDQRMPPADSDIGSPSILHPTMIDSAQKIHDAIDGFSFATTTKAIVLAGWGEPTLAGISYYEKVSCSNAAMTLLGKSPVCTKSLEHSATTTLLGDNTVVMQSAAAPISSSSDYYFDLGSESKGKTTSDGHSTILNTDSAVSFVKQQVTQPADQVQSLPPYISNKPPTMADVHQDDLVVSVHSPVELNVYDSQGNHTGPIPNPDPTSDLGRFETNIPGSEYVPNDGDTYVRVPYGTDYKITFAGTGMGSFEVDTEHDVNGVEATTTVFADMPVTPLLKAELVLATTTGSSATTTGTITQMILFDFDGNGTIDAITTPHDAYDPVLDMESEQTIISTLNLSPFKEKTMRDKIGIIIDCLEKKKPLKEVGNPDEQAIAAAQKAIADLQNQHWIFKNLDPTRKQELENIFQAFLDTIEVQQ